MNVLIEIIPPKGRKYLYALYALVGLVLGCIQVAYGVTEPEWVTVALAVYGFVGTAFGSVAAANVNPPPTEEEKRILGKA